MRTEKQIRASRENAKKSTGPRTTEGKANSSKNALKHGLMAQDAVIPGEDPAEFDRHLTRLEDTYLPRNYVEKELVRQIGDAMWRMQRLSRIETAVISASIERTRVYQHDFRVDRIKQGHEGDLQLLGESMLSGTKFLNNLARYDAHLNRRFYRAVELMMKIRSEERKSREAQAAAESLDAASHGPPSGRKRYVPAQAPPPIRAGTNQDRESPPDRPRPVIGFQWGRSPGLPGDEPESARGPNEKLQNEAEIDLTPAETTSYEATGAIAGPPVSRSTGLPETRGRGLRPLRTPKKVPGNPKEGNQPTKTTTHSSSPTPPTPHRRPNPQKPNARTISHLFIGGRVELRPSGREAAAGRDNECSCSGIT